MCPGPQQTEMRPCAGRQLTSFREFLSKNVEGSLLGGSLFAGSLVKV